jgi:hypothetical protein
LEVSNIDQRVESLSEANPPKTRRPAPGSLDAGLQTDSRQRQNPLKNGPQADQHHEQFEKIGQPAISNELVDGPKADRADHDDNQNPD